MTKEMIEELRERLANYKFMAYNPADQEIADAVGAVTKFQVDQLCDLALKALAPEVAEHERLPMAYIEHHKGGDYLVWDDPGGDRTPLYRRSPPQPSSE